MYVACTKEMNDDSGAAITTNPTVTVFCVTLLTLFNNSINKRDAFQNAAILLHWCFLKYFLLFHISVNTQSVLTLLGRQ